MWSWTSSNSSSSSELVLGAVLRFYHTPTEAETLGVGPTSSASPTHHWFWCSLEFQSHWIGHKEECSSQLSFPAARGAVSLLGGKSSPSLRVCKQDNLRKKRRVWTPAFSQTYLTMKWFCNGEVLTGHQWELVKYKALSRSHKRLLKVKIAI